MAKKNAIIIGAAGRDFHNFNTYYRDNDAYNVVAFTATQIPDIEGRKYPAELAGKLYPDGIPIYAEEDPDGCDVVVWDGGNNDFPFYKTDLHVTVTDPHRPGHELSYYPGEVTLRMADVVVINKIDSADYDGIETLRKNIAAVNPGAVVVDAASTLDMDDPSVVKGKRVLVVEDGPTLTHGEMKIGAGFVAAQKFGAASFVDPRPYAVGKLAETFEMYPNIGVVLPAMGYGDEQLKDLETTINSTECDAVVIRTPIDLSRIININKPHTRVYYNLQEIGRPNLTELLDEFVETNNLG